VRRATLLALLLVSCKDDPPHPADCPSGPDFEVLITALDAPLPADIRVSIEYAGGLDEYYSIPDHGKHHALFCAPSDRQGDSIPAGGHGGQGSLDAGESGRGGASAGSGLEGLACELWTDGPAMLTVETSMYPSKTQNLEAKDGKCTVATEIVLAPPDAGT
jgi:hypothetical protein